MDADGVRLLSGVVDGDVQSSDDGLDLREYWQTLRKRKFIILLTALFVLTATVVGSFLVRPIYRAVVTLQIERENPNILSFQEVQVIDAREDDFFQTHHLLLQSRSLMRRVIDQLQLASQPEFAAALPSGADNETVREARLVDELQSRIMVEPVKRSRLVGIGVETQNAELAASIANTLAASYIDMSLEAKFEATEAATEFLSNQIEALKIEIEEKKRNLQDYAQQSRMLSMDDNQNITVQRLKDLNTELTKAQTERLEYESSYNALQRSMGIDPRAAAEAMRKDSPPEGVELWRVPEVSNNQLVQTLRASHAQLQSRYVELGQRFAPDWPEMVRLRERLSDLETQIRREEWRIVVGILNGAQARFQAGMQRERELQANLEEQKRSVTELNRSAITYNQLKAEVDTKVTLLDSLLKRKSETDVSVRLKGLKSSNVRIVDRAEPPVGAVRPNKKVNAILGLVVGLGLGVAVAFFIEFLDNTIKSVEDVERHTGLPSFGIIPLFDAEVEPAAALGDGTAGTASTSLVTLSEARSAVSEAYRALRTSLLLSSAGSPPRSLLVTSSQPGEGKTTTVVNTAIALAQAGKQVLLIDADLRKPRCHKLLGLQNKAGLSTFLTGSSQLKELVQVTSVRNLFVLTSGPVPPNPSELLGSERMSELIKLIPGGIQHILLDSPPVLSVTDPALVATLVDGVMLVVRAGTTPWPLLKRTHRRMRDVNAKIIGVILNSVDSRSADYYSYSYSYGEEEA